VTAPASKSQRRRLSLRAKIVLHLFLIHAILAAMALLVLVENRHWLFAVEALFLLSLMLGLLLVRAFFVPLDLVRTGAELLAEQDFTSRFRETGQPEIDELVRVYNRMLERLREERLKLQEQNLFLHKVLAASPSGMLTLDLDKRIVYLNPAAERILALGAGAAVGRTLRETGTPLAAELLGLAPGDSRVVPVLGSRRARCSRVEYLEQGFARSFFVIDELTEQLRASEKSAYHKLIRMMSHEVNNSVGAVRSLLESFQSWTRHLPPDDRQDFAGALTVAGERLEHLTAFMTGFAGVVRLPAPERRPLDLRALLADLHTLLRPELARRRIAWSLDGQAELPPVLADKNQIEQVLVNILKNAYESIGEDGEIRVSLGREGERTRLAIHDTGAGLSPESRAAIFTPFYTTKRDGRGLGLTIIAEILTAHGFAFGLGSASEGGATFWIVF